MNSQILTTITALFFSILITARGQTTITSSSLPSAASTNSSALDRFSITGLSPFLTSSASNSANYTLREAGPNGVLGDNDDLICTLFPTYGAGLTVAFTINNAPLQPGDYRFETTTNLLDLNSNSVSVFTRDFIIANPVLGKIEDVSDNTLQEATILPLTESPPGSGLLSGLGVGTFSSTSDVDYWRFDAKAGDFLTVRLEASAVGIFPQLYLRNSADGDLQTVGGDNSGVAQFQNYQFATGGTYYLRVWSTAGGAGYRMRVDLARGPQLEIEPNDAQTGATVLSLTPIPGGDGARVAGALVSADSSGDYFRLTTLNSGNTISVNASFPGGVRSREPILF